ncbi:MAG: DUF5623 domain-containing protein [Alphaproteobacteria bacterium]
MLTDDVRPKTLDGIKQLAKRIKRREGCPHHVALERAAQAAGFSNYKHAYKQLAPQTANPLQLYLTVYWEDQKERTAGRETLTITLSRPLPEICLPPEMRKVRHLGHFRLAAQDHLVLDAICYNQYDARDRICGAVRYLRFMEATNLRPSGKRLRQIPAWAQGPLPQADHTTCWVDPDTGQDVILDEPYLDESILHEGRIQWAQDRNWHLRASATPSPYFPGRSSLYVATPVTPGTGIDSLLLRIACMPDPVVADSWTGNSVKGHEVFVSPGAVSDQDKKRAKAKALIIRQATRTTVPLKTRSAVDRRKPNGVMPFSDHRALGSALKRVETSDEDWFLTVGLSAFQFEMQDWLFKEHSESDHPDVDFLKVYLGLLDGQDQHDKAGQSQENVRQTLEWCAALLKRHYPDCAPLRRQLKRLSMSSDRVGQSSGDRREASAAT